ncbi:MAG: CPBP family intramembrane metalloprotease [Longimicrobiales bacterium]|nr:CPBP family intramembrane metalloprotease [Longimicrobiales bacterium]
MPAVVLRLVKGSLLFFPVLTALFWLGTPLGIWGALYLVFLLELLPALSVAQLPLVDDEGPLPRVSVYLSSGAIILGIGWMGVMVGWNELGAETMGIDSAPWGLVTIWTMGLSLAAFLLLWGFLLFRKAAGIQESPLLIELLPRTGREKVIFGFLSLAAGVGEEIAYRGYLIPALTLLLGWDWGAALVSSAVFGLLHAYQGWLGIARTASLGLVLAASFILSGTLWPAILAHASLDLIAGLVLGETLVRE